MLVAWPDAAEPRVIARNYRGVVHFGFDEEEPVPLEVDREYTCSFLLTCEPRSRFDIVAVHTQRWREDLWYGHLSTFVPEVDGIAQRLAYRIMRVRPGCTYRSLREQTPEEVRRRSQ